MSEITPCELKLSDASYRAASRTEFLVATGLQHFSYSLRASTNKGIPLFASAQLARKLSKYLNALILFFEHRPFSGVFGVLVQPGIMSLIAPH
ncbi:MAG TPA: hypothetical protein VJ372_10835 [Pyrinomonadaceae bacterium]|nr:hypothetical protein [Pyrinomonadaceae bacterium]